ncbi:hypothetical protein VNO77_04463 [Canavalia gladiata]|uniref:Uncharacterized protein n=1 Tax=Canavalia gladiata TaxID=3824 RepID=A0AAN9MX77_CANGL
MHAWDVKGGKNSAFSKDKGEATLPSGGLSVAKLLHQLNVMSIWGCPDHDDVVNAYRVIDANFFKNAIGMLSLE